MPENAFVARFGLSSEASGTVCRPDGPEGWHCSMSQAHQDDEESMCIWRHCRIARGSCLLASSIKANNMDRRYFPMLVVKHALVSASEAFREKRCEKNYINMRIEASVMHVNELDDDFLSAFQCGRAPHAASHVLARHEMTLAKLKSLLISKIFCSQRNA